MAEKLINTLHGIMYLCVGQEGQINSSSLYTHFRNMYHLININIVGKSFHNFL